MNPNRRNAFAAASLLAASLFSAATLAQSLAFAPPTSGAQQIVLKQDQSLWTLATQLQRLRAPATTNQIAWAVFRENPDAFADGSLMIRSGRTLKVPGSQDILSYPDAEAHKLLLARRSSSTEVRDSVAPPSLTPTLTVAAADSPAPLVVAATATPPATTATVPPTAFQRFQDSPEGRAFFAGANRRSPEENYRILAPLENKFAGDATYDAWLGRAALDGQQPDEGVYALMRSVEVNPDSFHTRLDLARAYLATNDIESARYELKLVQSQKSAPELVPTAKAYMEEVERRSMAYLRYLTSFLEVNAGYDNNANSATDENEFLGFGLNQSSTRSPSAVYGLSLGAAGSQPIGPGLRLVGDLNAQHRSFPDASFVDATTGGIAAGLAYKTGETDLGLSASGRLTYLDGESHNQLFALDGTMSTPLNSRWQLGLNLRLGEQRFEPPQELLDVRQLYGGASLSGVFESLPGNYVSVAATVGHDDPVLETSQYGRELYGLRLSVSTSLNTAWSLNTALSGLISDYGDNPFFGLPRGAEQQTSASIGLSWRMPGSSGLNIAALLTATQNQSDITLYDYSRVDGGFTVRKEFK